MDLKFLLTAIGLLAGIWVYLYKTISHLSINHPTNQTLVILGYAQFTVLSYLILALYILYATDPAATAATPDATLVIATEIFHHTWPIPLVCLVLAFLTAKASESHFAMMSYPIFLVIAVIAWATVQALHAQNPSYVIGFLAGIVVLGTPYMLLMSFFLADVEITTDKQFYTQADPVMVCVRPAGYIFRPNIKGIELGLYKRAGSLFHETIIIPPEKHLGDDVIFVDFVPQAISVKRRTCVQIKMVKLSAD